MTLKRIKRMNYMKTFKCIGGSCPDNCCIGWDVDIDKKTFEKYKSIEDSTLTDRFRSDVVKNKDCFDKEIDYGRMVLKSSKRCPFLNEKALCEIQMHHGEETLSKVCNAYPRVVNLVDGQLELSATISCPEVARIVLLDQGSLLVEEVELESERFIIAKEVDTKDKSLKNHPAKFFNELREFALFTMAHTAYSLDEKLLILGNVHHQLLPLHSGGNLDRIPILLSKAKTKLNNDDYRQYLKSIKSNQTHQLRSFNKYTRVLHGDSQINEQRFGRYFKFAIEGLKLEKAKTTQESINLYNKAMSQQVNTFILANERVFENYIINAMYEGMYPFSEEGDPYAGYTMLIVRYLMIKVLIAGSVSSGETLDLERLVDLIQCFSKTLEHHKTFMTDILNKMMASGEDDLSLLSQLI